MSAIVSSEDMCTMCVFVCVAVVFAVLGEDEFVCLVLTAGILLEHGYLLLHAYLILNS